MIETELTQKALSLCKSAHAGQFDKAGVPYQEHPIHVAEGMDDELSTCVALLHDVVEDTPLTFKDLEEQGFPVQVIEALKMLTHDDSVPYLEYVRNLSANPLATKVKLGDLAHNSDISRIPNPTQRDFERLEKYAKAKAILEK